MKVLVTGACGFIGSHMVEAAARAGLEVIAGDLPAALSAALEDRTRFPEVCRAAGARLTDLDLTDRSSVENAVVGAELVFHVAAVFDYLASESVLRAVNVEGTRNLFEALVTAGTCKRVVNWGAGGVFGLPTPDGRPFDEDSPKRPTNPYLRSKWDQELLANSYRERGIEVTTITPVSPYGPRAVYGSGQLLIGLAEKPVVLRNLTGNVPMGHVEDLCAAALHLAVLPEADGERYIATDDGRLSAVDIVRIVTDELGLKPKIMPPAPISVVRGVLSVASKVMTTIARRRGKRPLLEYDQVQYFGRDWRYSNEKLKKTGFEMKWPQPEPGIRTTVRWYLDQGWMRIPKKAQQKGR